MARGHSGKTEDGREPEYCDTCGERVGFYDPKLPEGEKIIITRKCWCVRDDEMIRRERK